MTTPTKQYAVINRVVKETEKSILIDANWQTWLPKSQVEVIETPLATVIALPTWLWMQHRSCLSIRTTPEHIYETTGIICR
jgi:hypothetical protein